MLTVGAALELTVMLIALLKLEAGVGQLAVLVITQLITSPFANEAEEKLAWLYPTLNPFTCH